MKNSFFSKMAADGGISSLCFLDVESKMAHIGMTIVINWKQKWSMRKMIVIHAFLIHCFPTISKRCMMLKTG